MRGLVSGLVLLLSLGAGTAGAQTTGARPQKNGHDFVPSTFIPDAFVDTELSIGLGYSNTIETEIPLFTSGGQQIGTVKGDLLFMTGGVEFNCAVRDWIGFFVRFNALARSGGNTASIFASGVSAGSGMGVGWEFRLMEDEKSVFSGSVSMDPASITLVDVAAFVDDPDRGLTRTFTPLIGSVQARYAYGFSDLIGVSTFVGFGLGENPKENYESTGFWKLGGIADINLSTRYGIPLGLALGARTSSYPLTFDNADGNTWAGLASVAYMGRKDLSITLDAVYEYVPIDYQDVSLGYLGYTLGLSYTF